jgi:hypothetical protein
MPEPKQSSSNIGSNGVVWLLLAAAGTYFVVHSTPLEGTRPPATESFLREQPSTQDVESRLWQDPFAAVADKLARSSEFKRENCEKPELKDHCDSPLSTAREMPLVMIASVSGAPYSEDNEYRRRLRYAILAGLSRRGFVPRDPEHLGFFWPRAVVPSPQNRLPDVVPFERFDNEKMDRAALLFWFDEDVLGNHPLRQFDEFICRVIKKDHSSTNSQQVLGPENSTTLRAMALEVGDGWSSEFCPKKVKAEDPGTEFYVFSATASDSRLIPDLAHMKFTDEGCRKAGDCLSQFFNKDFIGPTKAENAEKFSKFEKQEWVKLYRMTTTDLGLAKAMRDELDLRWPRRVSDAVTQIFSRPATPQEAAVPPPSAQSSKTPPSQAPPSQAKRTMLDGLAKALGFVDEASEHHIVLISESDTLYGRSLPEDMGKCLSPAKKGSDCKEFDRNFIHSFSYLRGLDGQLPNVVRTRASSGAEGAGESGDTADNQDKESKGRPKAAPGAKLNDRPEGQGQYDYLRRLGEQIGDLDGRLRSGLAVDPMQRSRTGVAAVGVLGSDRYDKLLILQALRPLLPNALFFTTDLEAQMWHPSAVPYTRNLLIASSFGSRLNDELQGDIPPFRSSYQTAAFLAMQAAVQSAVEGSDGAACTWREPPLLFEVGLTKLFQLPSVKVQSPSGQTKNASTPEKSPCSQLAKDGVQPGASEMFPKLDRLGPVAVAAAIVVLALASILSCRCLRGRTLAFLDSLLDFRSRRLGLIGPPLALIGGLGLLTVLLAWAISEHWEATSRSLTDGGQPMLLLEGISVWPTIALRAVILVLCVVLFIHAFQWLNKDFNRLAVEMEIKTCWDEIESTERKREEAPWTKFLNYFFYPVSADDTSDYKQRFWGPYIYQGLWPARFWRTLVGVAALFVLWGILELMFGNPPAPTRGPTSFWLYTVVSGLLNFTALFLTLFVADATWLCWRVIKALLVETDRERMVWPESTQKKFSGRVGVPHGDLEHWINLIFISKRTKCIATLIYFPFIIVALVIISRSRLFANYAPSLPEILVMAVGLLVVTGSAIALRQAAEASRAKAHRRLNDQIMLAKRSPGGESRAAQLELLSRRMDELSEGALTPFSQQPLLRAMLLPLGSFGGTALVENLLLPGVF